MNLPPDTWRWWQSQRRFYNFALLAAGLVAFLCYAAAAELCGPWEPDEIEITAFTVIGQAFGYLLMMAAANLLYMAGPIAEKIVQPRNVPHFRSRLFAAGLCFSVALPFIVPLTVIFKYIGKHP